MKFRFLVVCFMLFNAAIAQQEDRPERNNVATKQENPAQLILYREQLDAFILAFTQKFSGNPLPLDSFYFTKEEAGNLSAYLQNIKYPGADSSLCSTILEKNKQVRELTDIYARTYSASKHIRTTFRKGYTDDVEGFHIVFSLGDNDGWKETMRLILIVSDKKLKILSLKEEM